MCEPVVISNPPPTLTHFDSPRPTHLSHPATSANFLVVGVRFTLPDLIGRDGTSFSFTLSGAMGVLVLF